MTASLGCPFGVVPQQLDVQLVVTPCSPNIMGLSLISLTVEIPARGKKKLTKIAREIAILRGDGFASNEIFGLQRVAISGKDKLCFRGHSFGTPAQGFQGLANQAQLTEPQYGCCSAEAHRRGDQTRSTRPCEVV